MALAPPVVTVLGPDPSHRSCILNGNAFQQDAITSYKGWQYAAFYSQSSPGSPDNAPLFVHVARRELPQGPWEVLALKDYPQTVDDGHNTVQLGICAGDGTIHLSYDHHCDILRYRRSLPGVATDPSRFDWSADLFGPTLDHLPGLLSTHLHFGYVTYPRFFSAIGYDTTEDLWMSFRTGKAGLGDDLLYIYRGGQGEFKFIGTHLTGVANNPYVHGMDLRNGRLHITWVYRGFVHYPGWDDPLDTKHKQQAGPNGAENNYDICHAYSDDGGYTWRNNADGIIADLKKGETVAPDAPGITLVSIPKGSGLTNQESQAVDHEGGIHVLNRTFEGGPDGDRALMWKHFYRTPEGKSIERTIGQLTGGKRGRLAISKDGSLILILPDSNTNTLRILRAAKDTEANFSGASLEYKEVWRGSSLLGEPLIDVQRLEADGTLSVFCLKETGEGKRLVVVLDFEL